MSTPDGKGLVDCEPGLGRNPGPGITIGRMQPAAPKVERERRIGNRIGPAADPASSFKDGEREPRRCKPRGGADSGGARTDDDDISRSSVPREGMRAPCELICHANLDAMRTERKNTRRTRKIAETASRSCYETRLLARLELKRVGYAVLSTEGTADQTRCEFSRRTLWDHVSETEIDPRRCGRGRLRH